MPAAGFASTAKVNPEAVAKEAGHGHKQIRKAVVVSAKTWSDNHEFLGIKGFGAIKATRETDGKLTSETPLFALSWIPTPKVLLSTVRDHWAIENAPHWQLDISFREDAAHNRKDNAPGNIAVLRRRTLDVVQRHPSKTSLSITIKCAGWDAYLYAESAMAWPRLEPNAIALPPPKQLLSFPGEHPNR